MAAATALPAVDDRQGSGYGSGDYYGSGEYYGSGGDYYYGSGYGSGLVIWLLGVTHIRCTSTFDDGSDCL